MRLKITVTLLLLFVAAGGLALSARSGTGFVSADGISHGTMTCLQGIDGSGTRLCLRQHHGCEIQASFPYLEIDIREAPVPINKSIVLRGANSAFRCQKPKESCEQYVSGEVMFNHFEEMSGKTLQTDGWYELSFASGRREAGFFKVDCIAPCA